MPTGPTRPLRRGRARGAGGGRLGSTGPSRVGAPLSPSERQKIFHGVRDATAEVIASKGATNWAVRLAVARIPPSHTAR
jgi:hypothetical protein